MKLDTETSDDQSIVLFDDQPVQKADTDSCLMSQSKCDPDVMDDLLEQAKRYTRVESYIVLASAGTALAVVALFCMWCHSKGIEIDFEALTYLGVAGALPCMCLSYFPRGRLYAVLEKIASIAEKRDLKRLVLYAVYYKASHPFFQRMESLLSDVNEADAGLLTKSQQSTLLVRFTNFLMEAEQRYERATRRQHLAQRQSEKSRQRLKFWFPHLAERGEREEEAEKHKEEAGRQFAKSILEALSYVGDRSSLQEIEKAIRKYPHLGSGMSSSQWASDLLSRWRERLSRQEVAAALLRPSSNSDTHQLLHPAGNEPTPAQELLRAGMSASPSPENR